jgi:SNF2 family DNA or RNA helicase
MDDHEALSGKLKTLAILCKKFKRNGDRVLIFSQSTTSLDIIDSWIKTQGHRKLRLDGSTPTSKRQGLVNQFQSDDTIFAFLISTRAGGMGLNLTAANRVIIYDVNWNPSHDEQAQDRAFRIGQMRNVQVYVARAFGMLLCGQVF